MPRARSIAIFGSLAVAGIVFVVFARAREAIPDSVGIGVATWPGFAPAYVAKEHGYFGSTMMTIDVLDDFSARRAAYESGQHQFTIYTIDSFAFDIGKGLDGQIVMVLDESRGADGIVARAHIATAADLRGKSVAYTRGSPAHFFLVNYLRGAGLSIADIRTVEVDDPTRAAQAFMGGTVDAAVTWEPYLSQIKTKGVGKVLADTSTMPGLIVDVLVASRSTAKEHPDIVRTVVSGWLKALAEVRQPRADTYSIMAKSLGMKEDEFKAGAAGILFSDEVRNRHWLGTTAGTNVSRGEALFDEAAKIWITEKLSSAPPLPAGAYFARDFVSR